MTNFGELLSEFHDAYDQYGREPFWLNALTREEYQAGSDRGMLAADDEGSILGFVTLDELNPWYICVDIGWAHLTEQPERLNAPFALYRRLASAAGAFLPRAIRDSYQCNAGEPVSAWLTFLWWFETPTEEDFDLSLEGTNSRVFSHNPFRQGADAIETCALHTPNPVFRRQHETDSPPKRRKPGMRVSPETADDRELVYGRWLEYVEICREPGFPRPTYANFAMYCQDKFDDMPTLNPVEIGRMIKAHKKNPDPISREE